MKNGFEEILNICLERVTAKGESVEQCLESYPEHVAELEPLLRAALSVSEASSAIKPRPEFERIARARLLSALEDKSKRKAEHRMPLWHWQRRWAVALAAILILVLIGGSTVTASASSLPGDVLYPVKTATEKVQGFFTFGSEAKANFHVKLAQRRLNELELLAGGNRTIPQSLLNSITVETTSAMDISFQEDSVKTEKVRQLLELTYGQTKVLEKVMEKASGEAEWKLRDALIHSQIAHMEALLMKKKDLGMELPR